ncbi:hypothetical protein B0H17DRAFT_1205934 [Mycena rosella]|uniref:Uncharacterized protein n=1 Tax=Mycena rosella TaxID=1033263 RepID=A0AAD7D6Q2_MYCRO|nr:hypothetical protein B0H17DRAFT_1205934 [Mycena rosella]
MADSCQTQPNHQIHHHQALLGPGGSAPISIRSRLLDTDTATALLAATALLDANTDASILDDTSLLGAADADTALLDAATLLDAEAPPRPRLFIIADIIFALLVAHLTCTKKSFNSDLVDLCSSDDELLAPGDPKLFSLGTPGHPCFLASRPMSLASRKGCSKMSGALVLHFDLPPIVYPCVVKVVRKKSAVSVKAPRNSRKMVRFYDVCSWRRTTRKEYDPLACEWLPVAPYVHAEDMYLVYLKRKGGLCYSMAEIERVVAALQMAEHTHLLDLGIKLYKLIEHAHLPPWADTSMKTGTGLADTWVRMLEQVHRRRARDRGGILECEHTV